MSVKNIVEMVNVSGELGTNEDKWMIEKIRSCPHTVTAKGKRYMVERGKLDETPCVVCRCVVVLVSLQRC